MSTNKFHDSRIDRYVRNQLSAEEEAAFELELFDSPELQDQLEAVLALHGALAADAENEDKFGLTAVPAQYTSKTGEWKQLALAASVALAVLSTVMWWKQGNDLALMEEQVLNLSQPRTDVLRVQLPIMRSGNTQTPDVIVQRPGPDSAMLFDIELSPTVAEQAPLVFALTQLEGESVISWQSTPATNGRASVLINTEQVPASRLWLEISSTEGELLERRLLEFR